MVAERRSPSGATPILKAARTVRSVARREGWRGLAQRSVRTAYRRLGVDALEFPLLPGDVADSHALPPRSIPAPRPEGQPLTVAWVTTPPGIGSGGHTTMFRMVRALERAGHTCVLYLYDRYGGELERHEAVIRQGWPDVAAEVRDSADGIRGVDAAVATSWQTAHVLARRAPEAHTFYFIQDFEPFFTGRGSEYELAEDSYRLGHRAIALGRMVAGLLDTIGVEHDFVPFGCDSTVYSLLTPQRERRGVVFYARPGTARRGFELGVLALAQFHERHPDQPIHLYGARPRGLPFRSQLHGSLSPTALNELYNSTVGGLALSFTNISLVAAEMLAAGAIPVVNDSPYSRADLPNPFACWAAPTPSGLAEGLGRIVSAPDVAAVAAAAAQSIHPDDWVPAGRAVTEIIERGCRG